MRPFFRTPAGVWSWSRSKRLVPGSKRLSLRWLRSYDYLPLLHDTNWITLCQPLDSSISELPYKLYAIFLNIIPYYSRFSSVAIFFFNPFTEQRCFFSIVVHTLRSLVLEKKLLRTNKVKPSVVKKNHSSWTFESRYTSIHCSISFLKTHFFGI